MGVPNPESQANKIGRYLIDKLVKPTDVVSTQTIARDLGIPRPRVANAVIMHFSGVVENKAGFLHVRPEVNLADLEAAVNIVHQRRAHYVNVGKPEPQYRTARRPNHHRA